MRGSFIIHTAGTGCRCDLTFLTYLTMSEPPASLENIADELILHILDLVNESDLFTIASVSRRLRAVTMSHDDYVFECQPPLGVATRGSGQIFAERANALLQALLPMRISVHQSTVTRHFSNDAFQAFWDLVLPALENVLRAGLVVELSIYVPDEIAERMFTLLERYSMPRLRRFHLTKFGPPMMVPPHLFAGDAPRLRFLALSSGAHMPKNPLEAFAQVQGVDLLFPTADLTTLAGLGEHFPRLEELKIRLSSFEVGSSIRASPRLEVVRKLHLNAQELTQESTSPEVAAFLYDLVPHPSAVWIDMPITRYGAELASISSLLITAYLGCEASPQPAPPLTVRVTVDERRMTVLAISLPTRIVNTERYQTTFYVRTGFAHLPQPPTCSNLTSLAHLIRILSLPFFLAAHFRDALVLLSVVDELRIDMAPPPDDLIDYLPRMLPRIQLADLSRPRIATHVDGSVHIELADPEQLAANNVTGKVGSTMVTLFSAAENPAEVTDETVLNVVGTLGAIPAFLPLPLVLSNVVIRF